jgi:Ca2+-binding EF-hand superfamily protein
MKMFKHLKAIATMGAMTAALMASAPAFADNEFVAQMWSPKMMTAMDKNKDGTVTRQEFLDYMGAQFDIMDTKKSGRLGKGEFTDKKMMIKTFDIMG